jgi:hypothetical protein
MSRLFSSKTTAKSGALLMLVAALAMIPMSGTASAETGDRQDSSVVALPGYHVSVFARGAQGVTGPDPIVVDRGHVFVDSAANTIYTITADFKPGTVYTEAPSDSDVASFVGTINLQTGAVTPVAIGFKSPTGLLFTTGEDGSRDS